VGALLATTPDSSSAGSLKPLSGEHSQRLEHQIDAMQSKLSALNAFILPGGHPAAAWAHVARTVCRRVERRVVLLAGTDQLIKNGLEEMLVYINRLSDYFFMLARYCNHLAGVEDVLWRG
jgi:cob(I)alamin adenosyltransferase